MSDEYKQFWIDDILNFDQNHMRSAYLHYDDTEKFKGKTIHVIEYTAYEQLKEKLELTNDIIEDLKRTEKGCFMSRDWIAEAYQKITQLEDEIERLKEKYDELKDNYKESTKTINERGMCIDILTRKNAGLKAELSSLNDLCNKLDDSKEMLRIEATRLTAALNKIGMLGKSELAYTSEFTERVTSIVNKALSQEQS